MRVNERSTITPRLRQRVRRIRVVTALLALIQAGAALRALVFPPNAAVSLSPPLEFVGASAWTLVFGFLALRPHNGRACVSALIAFAAYSAARLLIFTRADYDAGRLPFALVAVAVSTGIVVLYLMRPAVWRAQVNGDDV